MMLRNDTNSLTCFFKRQVFRPLAAFTVFCLLFAPARADNIDTELLKRCPVIIKKLASQGHRRVGVMPFMYQLGDTRSTFHGGLLSENMAERLTYGLVLKMNSNSPEFMLLRDSAKVANKNLPGASYRTKTDRAALFGIDYPVLWGRDDPVKPDVFLAGKIKVDADLRKTTIFVGAFDKEQMYDLVEFEVPTDRSILADIGEGFSLAKGKRKFLRGSADDAALDVIDEAKAEQKKADDSPRPTKTAGDFPIKMSVYYDGVKQDLRADSGANNFTLAEPKEGQEITIGLHSDEAGLVGAVLTVNGVSTLHEERGDAVHMKRWVLEPRKEYRVKGYHQEDGEKYFTIRAKSDEESKRRFDDLGGEAFAGLIHLHAFVPSSQASAPPFSQSIGRLQKSSVKETAADDLADLKQDIAQNSFLIPDATRGLFGWGIEKSEHLKKRTLGKAEYAGVMIVRYYPKQDK